MIVGVALFELHIESAQSLKDKRSVVKSLRERLRHKFLLSVAEVAFQELHQRARLAAVAVSSDEKTLVALFESVSDYVENSGGCRVLGTNTEFIQFDQGAPLDLPEVGLDEFE